MLVRGDKLFTRFVAIALSMAFTAGSAVAADTKGRVSGMIVDPESKPVAGAVVTMQSPSDTESARTDAQGHYAFVSLPPDTYVLTAHHDGFHDASRADIYVQADIVKDESLMLASNHAEIGHVSARSRDGLVQPGVTADEYSINATQAAAAHALGGGNERDTITSSLALVPGVFVPVGQAPGWGQSVFIRGGDYTQTGFEYDGVPLNRSFDQYAQSSLSSLGTQELQVYTGAAPLDQQTEGIGGYVNQIVKSGTYPNTLTVDAGIGSPSYYNKADIEFSGANGPDKKVTYYIGVGGYGFTQRLVDQYNGSGSVARYGPIAGFTSPACAPNASGGCYANGTSTNYIGSLPIQPNGYQTLPTFWGEQAAGNDEEVVGNFHIAIPHHRDKTKDDLQFLYTNSQFHATPNASVAELGAANIATYNPYYLDQNYFTGPLFATLTNNQIGLISNNFYHGHQGIGYNDPLALNQDDSQLNEFSLGKLTYRHNISSDSNVRLTLYSDESTEWQNGIVGLFLPYANGAAISDYSLTSQTTGIDAAYTKQFNAKNLVNVDLGENTTKSLRLNNLTAGFGGSSPIALLVNSTIPTGGCYGPDTNGNIVLTNCASSAAASYALPAVAAVNSSYQLVQNASGNPTLANVGSYTCGTGPCSYYTVSNGSNVSVSSSTSRFSNFSVGDHIIPTKNLALDLGIRYDLFQYFASNTDNPANQLYVNTFNQLHCISGTTLTANPNPGSACPAGTTVTNLTDISRNESFNELSPRLGAAYTLNPDNVLRFSYGRYSEAAPSAAEYSSNTGPFYPSAVPYAVYGFNSPTRTVQPEVSYNTDLTWEHQFRDNATSMKITPFYRTTNNEFGQFVIDSKTNFVALVNGLNRQSSGVELALRHGDFKKNGISTMFAYTFTHSVAQFAQSPSGGSFVTVANQAIQNYNGFTSYCSTNPGSGLCPQAAAVAGAPCYTASGAPAPGCGAGTIANPYWNAKPATLLDPKGSYTAYNTPLATGAGGGSTSNTQPNVASLIVNYRHNRLAVTPSFQYEAGARYGSPLAAQGVNPASCSAGLSTALVNDPRYPNGAPTGAAPAAPYDAASCTSVMAIPDPYTGAFDGVGQFVQPSLITMNLQMTYDASKNTTIELTATNLLYRCFGGSKVPWTAGNLACNYVQGTPYVGNVFNPGDSIQQIAQFPYTPQINPITQTQTAGSPLPFQVYLDVKFKM